MPRADSNVAAWVTGADFASELTVDLRPGETSANGRRRKIECVVASQRGRDVFTVEVYLPVGKTLPEGGLNLTFDDFPANGKSPHKPRGTKWRLDVPYYNGETIKPGKAVTLGSNAKASDYALGVYMRTPEDWDMSSVHLVEV